MAPSKNTLTNAERLRHLKEAKVIVLRSVVVISPAA